MCACGSMAATFLVLDFGASLGLGFADAEGDADAVRFWLLSLSL